MIATLLTICALSAPQFITAQSGVRLRASAGADGAEVAKLPIGQTLTQIDAPGAPVTIDGKQGTWEHVATADGKQGYLFSTGLVALDSANPAKAYLDLWESRRTNKKLTFPERADLFKMLDQALKTRGDALYQQATVDIDYARLKALQLTLAKVGNGEKQPFKGFLKEYEESVVYSEPAGEWFVETTPYWKRVDDYLTHKLDADELAWALADIPIAGECEGNVGCYLSMNNMMGGEYLRRFPAGKHTEKIVKDYAGWKKDVANYTQFMNDDPGMQGFDDAIKACDEALVWVNATNAKAKPAAISALNAMKKAAVEAKKKAPPQPAE